MQKELNAVYGINSTIVYNCIDSNIKLNYIDHWPSNEDEIRIVYTGAIIELITMLFKILSRLLIR